jgi:hypothetical protein
MSSKLTSANAGKDWIMTTQRATTSENSVDKIARKLDEFPELLDALREYNVLTSGSFCERLLNSDDMQDPPDFEQANPERLFPS